MVDHQPDIPMSQRMPIEVLKAFNGPLCDKLARQPDYTSTFAFMIATAVMGIVQRRRDPHVPEPGEVIHVCGVEMLNGEEIRVTSDRARNSFAASSSATAFAW